MADLTPHPLVSRVVAALIRKGALRDTSDVKTAIAEAWKADTALAAAVHAAAAAGKPVSAAQAASAGKNLEQAEAAALAAAAIVSEQASQSLARASGLPELVTFAGYVGATLPKEDAATDKDFWTVLYLDTHLQTWLLVHTKGIVYRDAAHDKQAPLGQRDILWVRADTPVGRGDGSLSVQSQFLTGTFTQAGDFDTEPSGGTLAASTGVFCEARSVGCCRPRTPRP